MKFHKMIIVSILAVGGLLQAQQPAAINLDQLIEIGMANHTGILIAEKALKSAKAGYLSSYSGLIPNVSTSIDKDLDPSTDTLYDAGVARVPPDLSSRFSVGQTLFDGGAAWYNRKAGSNSVKKARADYENARQTLVLNVKQAYYNYLSSKKLLGVAEEALELGNRQLELVEERYRLQAVSLTDLLKARVSSGERKIQVANAKRSLVMAQTSLNLAIGQSPDLPLEVVDDNTELVPLMDKPIAKASMMSNNPVLISRGYAVDNAHLTAKMARGGLLPTVSVGYSQSGYGSGSLGNAYDNDQSNTGMTISIPLFTGFRNSSAYRRARQAAMIEEDNQLALELDLLGSLENTFADLEALHEIYPLNQEVLQSAEADVELASEKYRLGVISILDLLDAQVSLISARSTLVRTTYDIKTAEAQLAALIGTIE
ncbi:TolC family protein [Candidatus Neomarinimicrobiota bacterium]